MERHPVGDRFYEPFFLRSAHRFFIANDNRLLPSAVMPPRFFPSDAVASRAAPLTLFSLSGEADPSSVAMARLILSLFRFRSATILATSKIRSFLLSARI